MTTRTQMYRCTIKLRSIQNTFINVVEDYTRKKFKLMLNI